MLRSNVDDSATVERAADIVRLANQVISRDSSAVRGGAGVDDDAGESDSMNNG